LVLIVKESTSSDVRSSHYLKRPFHSSAADGPRDVTFENQQSILKKAFPTANLPIVQLSELGVREQIELVSQKTEIFW
jgi:hypothetical protein